MFRFIMPLSQAVGTLTPAARVGANGTVGYRTVRLFASPATEVRSDIMGGRRGLCMITRLYTVTRYPP